MAAAGLYVVVGTAVLAVLVSFALHVALNCPISPLPTSPPSSSSHDYPSNNLLQRVEKLGEGRLDGPEDVLIDAAGGMVYTATRDGWVQRMHPNGSWEHWRLVGGTGLLGLATSADGSILVCDAHKGLLRVGEEGTVTLLASEVEGTQIRFADAAIEASDGTVYFSDASSRFGFDDWFLDYLEARPNGRLLKYDPRTKKANVMLANMSFANGVALSPDEDFLLISETFRLRCLKLWLKGEKEGQTEVFIDNLPGGPDNIHLAPDGSFWIALVQLRSKWLNLISRSSVAKRVIASFPALVEKSKSLMNTAMVIQVSEEGKIVRMLDDSQGKVMGFVTSATEFDGHLFIGSLGTNFIGKLPPSSRWRAIRAAW